MPARSPKPGHTVCNHCGAHYPRQPTIPVADDDAAWSEIARHHKAQCVWVRTRAGRLTDAPSQSRGEGT
jgi:hypothetical protein